MVILEAIGIASKEVFDYNRENFKFDQEQRLERDLSRLEMQIKRFDLFRQDIEDLVKLTVDKMDMYHLIGALFLGFTTTIYCEGRVEEAPSWFNGLYLLTVASSFVYLLLAVWLSMHASISSHSFGVRLRTRYVRLPIPSLSQIASLTAKLSDFENQGVARVMRVPFATAHAQQWQLSNAQTQESSAPGSGNAGMPLGAGLAKAPKSSAEDILGPGDDGFAREDVLMTAAAALPGKHVHLFRRLQSKWQCYDAYARVSMTLGVHQMLNSLNYYMIGVNLIQWKCPTTAYACTVVFQSAALAINLLDISGWSKTRVTLLQLMGSLPIIIIQVLLTIGNSGRSPEEKLRPFAAAYHVAPVAYFAQAIWFALLLAVARPSDDDASLPRRFRAVLFLDVFGDASYDPTEAEHAAVARAATPASAARREVYQHLAAAADNALATAQAALRRWEAVPPELLLGSQREVLTTLRREHMLWRQTFHGCLVQQKAERGISYDASVRDAEDLRTWAELSAVEKQEDEFAEALLGPLEQTTSSGTCTYHLDLENTEHVWEELIDQRVLTLQEVVMLVRKAKAAVRALLRKTEPSAADEGDEEDSESGSEGSTDSKPDQASALDRKAKDRLPWKIIRRMTKLLALCWFVLGAHLILQNGRCYVDSGECEALHPEEAFRRLHVAEVARVRLGDLKHLQVVWPHGTFLRPETLSCPLNAAGHEGLLVGSRYMTYHGRDADPPVRLSALPRSTFPPGSVWFGSSSSPGSIAAAKADAPHLLGALVQDGIAIWSSSSSPRGAEAVVLRLQGRPWRLLAGAAVPCSDTGMHGAPWCLILAGWDGERLPIAVLLLPGGPGKPPAAAERVEPRFDAPLLAPQRARRCGVPSTAGSAAKAAAGNRARRAAQERGRGSGRTAAGEEDLCQGTEAEASMGQVVALNLDARRGWLWAILADGELQAWDLFQLSSLGQWRPHWLRGAGHFRPAALCTDGSGGLVVAGTSDADGPKLMRAQVLLPKAAGPSGRDAQGSVLMLSRSGSNSTAAAEATWP